MFRAGEVRVVTAAARENGKSTLLKDLIADPKWTEAVEASPLKEHFLSAMPYEEFIAEEGSRVLSYRWSNIVTLDCAVTDPAGVVTATKGAMALSVLDTPAKGWTHLWVGPISSMSFGQFHHLYAPIMVIHTK